MKYISSLTSIDPEQELWFCETIDSYFTGSKYELFFHWKKRFNKLRIMVNNDNNLTNNNWFSIEFSKFHFIISKNCRIEKTELFKIIKWISRNYISLSNYNFLEHSSPDLFENFNKNKFIPKKKIKKTYHFKK